MKQIHRIAAIIAVLSCLSATRVLADDPNDPAASHEPGIYHFTEAGGQKKMTKIVPTSYGKTKQGFAYFGGFGQQTKSKAVIEGGHASVQINEARPVFYFYFGATAGGLGEDAGLDPESYALSQMELKDHETSRRVVIGKAGAWSSKAGADKNAVRGFSAEKVSPGVFKVTVTQDLANGEYCFFRPVGGAGTIFDFGIRSGETATKSK